MDKVLKILQEQLKLYENSLKDFSNTGNSIIEFCKIPLEQNFMPVNNKEKKELEKIINRIKSIQNGISKI